MTPEILIVGDPAGRRQLADQIAAVGYGVSLCSPRELNRRIRTTPPAAIVACMGDLDADVLLAGLRRTRAGASIPVLLYGRLGGPLRDLADVLDLGADAFVEEPTSDRELLEALSQFVRPAPVEPRSSSRGRSERDEPRRRPRGEALGELHRTLDRLEASLRTDETPGPGSRSGSDPELAELGFDRIPDVDPEGDPLVTEVGEHLRGRVRDYEPVRGDDLGHSDSSYQRRSRERPGERERIGERERPIERPGERERPLERERPGERPGERERPRPRSSRDPAPHEGTERLRSGSDRRSTPERDDGGRRSWRDESSSLEREREPSRRTSPSAHEREDPSEQSGVMRTRSWDRSEHEGPLRPRRDPPARDDRGRDDRGRDDRGSRSSAVLLGRRPDRDARGEGDSGEGTSRLREPSRETSRDQPVDPATLTERYDPHAREIPWPEDDFDPSESTMIRRERSSATTRRRSLGNWSEAKRSDKIDEFPWGRGNESSRSTSGSISTSTPGSSSSSGSTARGRPPARSESTRGRDAGRDSLRSRDAEPTFETEFTDVLEDEGARETPPPTSTPRISTRRTARTQASASPTGATVLRIDPSLRENGKLSPDVDVATVLWALHDQRFTGKLRLVRARVEKQVWLHDGEAVFARSTATSDRLVDGLLRRGVLTRPQYETARRLAAKEPRRAGQLLVDAGFLKARELDVLLRDHLARVIDSTFVWTDGTWSTEPGDRTDEPIQLEVPMAAMILDGVRYRCDASELEERLTRRVGGRGPLVPRLKVKGDDPNDPDNLGGDDRAAIDELIESLGETFRLLPEEESWLRRLDGRLGVAALIADGADEQALFALLFTLDLAGVVNLREEPEPIVEGTRDTAQIDAERILERLRLAREADYFELLGLGRDASRSEIRQAHAELGTTFSDDALEEDARRRHARELHELRAALEEARDILIDDAMRSAYLAHLGDEA